MIRSVEPQTYLFADDGDIPNHPQWPLAVYPGALKLPDNDPAGAVQALLAENGWLDSWRNGVFSFPHYHADTHEALVCYSGNARILFGGREGVEVRFQQGDAAVLPAGTGHQNLGASSDFAVVGAYPRGFHPDLQRGGSRPPDAVRRIRAVSAPKSDPVYGAGGPLARWWAEGLR